MGPITNSMKKSSRVTKNTREYMIFLKREGLSRQLCGPLVSQGNKWEPSLRAEAQCQRLHV